MQKGAREAFCTFCTVLCMLKPLGTRKKASSGVPCIICLSLSASLHKLDDCSHVSGLYRIQDTVLIQLAIFSIGGEKCVYTCQFATDGSPEITF